MDRLSRGRRRSPAYTPSTDTGGAGRAVVRQAPQVPRGDGAAFQQSVNAFIRQSQYYGDVTWLLDYAEVLVMPRAAANQGRNLAEGLQTTKRALSHSRCHEECRNGSV